DVADRGLADVLRLPPGPEDEHQRDDRRDQPDERSDLCQREAKPALPRSLGRRAHRALGSRTPRTGRARVPPSGLTRTILRRYAPPGSRFGTPSRSVFVPGTTGKRPAATGRLRWSKVKRALVARLTRTLTTTVRFPRACWTPTPARRAASGHGCVFADSVARC